MLSFEKFVWGCFERCCDPDQHFYTWVAAAAFDSARIGQVNSAIDGKLFLRQAPRLTQPLHIRADDGFPVLHRQENKPSGQVYTRDYSPYFLITLK